MKRLLYILPLLILFACSREQEGSALYQQYASRADLTVAQVTGVRLNDTVKTDVVIIVANDRTAWQELKEEFDIRTSEGVTSWMGDINNPQKCVKGSVRPAWRAMTVHEEHTIAFYRIESEVQRQAMLDFQLDRIDKGK